VRACTPFATLPALPTSPRLTPSAKYPVPAVALVRFQAVTNEVPKHRQRVSGDVIGRRYALIRHRGSDEAHDPSRRRGRIFARWASNVRGGEGQGAFREGVMPRRKRSVLPSLANDYNRVATLREWVIDARSSIFKFSKLRRTARRPGQLRSQRQPRRSRDNDCLVFRV